MCRLFGLSASPRRITATFWLLDAPDSLANQSRREPDGVGLGVFAPDGTAVVHRRPIAAYRDTEFAREAREVTSGTFLAHIRYASTGGLRVENTHPFVQDGRLFARNGVVTGLDRLRDKVSEVLGEPVANLVHGDTDSELVFALITAYARRWGDLERSIVAAVDWIGANLPVYALNLIITTATDLWALRYPDTHPLYVLVRPAGGHQGRRHLEHASASGRVRVRCGDLTGAPATVVASEPMDEDSHWRLLEPGELLHVAADQRLTSRIAVPAAPRHPLRPGDLDQQAARSQHSRSGAP
ncbi:class II glutamine amidotransferase [Umezawaea sp. Da 62-37]|uniref:class II glutamine amidotransferase n=1 Tax=Umezawaea sp. Da 62-37 TaxID=3075927 RepID=UPI0028F716C0|nr:class II glutamine amidotransferase [Umezawaea sp. Da 62-37]WNV84849.1 class II glutamine amidotransferase [Umezawaea sp. Da 62-37]